MALCVALRWRKMVVLNTATCVTIADVSRHQASCRSTRQPTTSSVARFEVLHESCEPVDPLFGEGIVDGCPDAADRSMPFEPVESGLFRLFDEPLLEIFARKPERHIHQRPAVFLRRPAIKTRAIDFGVQLARLPLVHLRDRLETTLAEQPLGDE